MKNKLTLKENIQSVVQEIYEKSGEVRASILVEKASDPESPAHEAFEWDNTKAGHEYRLIQARKWLVVIEIIVDKRPTRLVHVPITISEDESYMEKESYYKPISLVSKNAVELELAISELQKFIDGAQRRINELLSCVSRKEINKKINVKKLQKGIEIVKQSISK